MSTNALYFDSKAQTINRHPYWTVHSRGNPVGLVVYNEVMREYILKDLQTSYLTMVQLRDAADFVEKQNRLLKTKIKKAR